MRSDSVPEKWVHNASRHSPLYSEVCERYIFHCGGHLAHKDEEEWMCLPRKGGMGSTAENIFFIGLVGPFQFYNSMNEKKGSQIFIIYTEFYP